MTIPLKAVVTGAAGHLGSHLVPELLKLGFQVTGLDLAPSNAQHPSGYRFVAFDLSNSTGLKEVVQDADLVLHCASLHPWKPYTDEQYLDANIKGTWNLYTAAAEAGVKNIVLTSSIAAIGYHAPPAAWPVDEENFFSLTDLYSLTKHSQEDIARLFADSRRIRTIALRPPAFFPLSNLATGFSLTGAFAVVEDIVAAHVAAARVMTGLQPPEALQPFEAVFVTNKLPYTKDDAALYQEAGNVKPLVEKHWPQAYKWLLAQGYQGTHLPTVYNLSKAERLLGWRPMMNFEQWFAQQGVTGS